MPKLSCRSCGRQIYATSPIESLFGEERRCPRCGALLHEDRREAERRVTHRRMNPPHDPGPPKPKAKPKPKAAGTDIAGAAKTRPKAKAPAAGDAATDATAEDVGERRVADRRAKRRRGSTTGRPATAADDSSRWRD